MNNIQTTVLVVALSLIILGSLTVVQLSNYDKDIEMAKLGLVQCREGINIPIWKKECSK